MPQYMMIYKGEATDRADLPEAQVQEIMAKWERVYRELGRHSSTSGHVSGQGRDRWTMVRRQRRRHSPATRSWRPPIWRGRRLSP